MGDKLNNMVSPVEAVCITLLFIFFTLVVIPKSKRESVVNEFGKLIKLFPISQIIQAFTSKKKEESN